VRLNVDGLLVYYLSMWIDLGNLNISNLELEEIPEDVVSMYDLPATPVVIDFSSKSSGWFESVDLERFNAAGNMISMLDERILQEFGAIRHFDVFQSSYCD
jgi:hypothetical protein